MRHYGRTQRYIHIIGLNNAFHDDVEDSTTLYEFHGKSRHGIGLHPTY